MMQRHLTLVSILIALVIFVAVNMLGTKLLSPFRADFTENKIYTLSNGTKDVLAKLDEPVTVRMFFSEKDAVGFPAIQSYAARVKGILEQYARVGGGKLKFEYITPEAFSEEEDVAVSAGMQGVPINESGTKLYFGVSATGATDETVAIPFLNSDRQSFLEYDLSRLIDDAAHPKKTVIGLITGAPMQGGMSGMLQYKKPWALYNQLQDTFDLRTLQPDAKEIPQDVKLLFIVHPHNITPTGLQAVDQFILKGGRAIIFLDANSITQPEAARSDMSKLLSAWGVAMVPDRVAADEQAAMRVQLNDDGDDGTSMQSAMNVTWLSLTDDDTINRADVSTAQLRMIRLIESGYFVLKPDAPVTATTLLSTHKPAESIDAKALIENKKNPVPLQSLAQPEKEKLALAIRIEGKVKTAFPEVKTEGHLSESTAPIHVVLVGDSDMLVDDFWVNEQSFFGKRVYVPTSDNGGFALNLIDSMSGSPELIGLRSRGTEDRPFEVVSKMRQEAEKRYHAEEQRLKKKLSEIESNMRAISKEKEEGGALFSDAEQKEMKNFRSEMLYTRKQLRDVQRGLQEDINALGTRLQWINIGLMPAIILLLSFFLPSKLGVRRRKKSTRAHE
ncbi:MAG: Gldg family protein [Rickettsiales bacterium]